MSKTLRTLLKNGTGWRNESLYNSGVRNLFEIMKYEILDEGAAKTTAIRRSKS